jgi:hypothetical protein
MAPNLTLEVIDRLRARDSAGHATPPNHHP